MSFVEWQRMNKHLQFLVCCFFGCRMWSIWMFTVPSLRARDCTNNEKDALNILFLAIPLLNVTLPFIWKSFPFIYTADVIAMAGVYAWKGLIPGMNTAEEESK